MDRYGTVDKPNKYMCYNLLIRTLIYKHFFASLNTFQIQLNLNNLTK